MNDGSWHHAVLVVDKTGGTQTLYLDGSVAGSHSGTPDSPYPYVYLGTGYTAGWPNAGSSWFYFNGSIDDVRVYNRALSAAEIGASYSITNGLQGWWKLDGVNGVADASAPTNGLVGYWAMNESGNTSTVTDSAGSNNGTLVNYPADQSADWVAGRYGNALSFDGSTQYVDLGTSLDITVPYTISAWVNPSSGTLGGIF